VPSSAPSEPEHAEDGLAPPRVEPA
jgi:hypothetical protein